MQDESDLALKTALVVTEQKIAKSRSYVDSKKEFATHQFIRLMNLVYKRPRVIKLKSLNLRYDALIHGKCLTRL